MFVTRNDRLTEEGGTAILVRHGIDHHVVPVLGLQHLEATDIQGMLPSKPVKILVAYLSPTHPLLLRTCLPGLAAVSLSSWRATIMPGNARLITKIGRPYAEKKSCQLYEPDVPSTVPYNHFATPDVLDIAVAKDLVFPVYLTTCSALSSDHLPIPVDTQCRSSFLSLTEHPDLRTDLSKYQACLEAGLPSNPGIPNEVVFDACVKELSSAISKKL